MKGIAMPLDEYWTEGEAIEMLFLPDLLTH